ncbi:DUF2470 domain-containing protein [Salinispora arenicola]|uniref:DUF2470 domain-containing protein n=1 Tax=Salinispora arenicola TaxID=168697 RepID=UPI0003729AA2|nr:DUF2470 domain-containing protein [Salinispora arenicola]
MAFHPGGWPAGPTGSALANEAISEAPLTGSRVLLTDHHAVLARSALSAAMSLQLRLGDAAVDLIESHAVLPDGTVILAVDAMSPTGGLLVAARGRSGEVQLDVTQLVPVAVRSRVRARVRVTGTAHRFDPASLELCDGDTVMSLLNLPPVALWAIDPVEVAVTSGYDDAMVSASAYRATRPDPLATLESTHLQHLAQYHQDVIDQLATLVSPTLTAKATRVVPVAVDADGVVLRAEAPDGHVDVRLPFACRVTSGASLAEGLRTLLAKAAPHRSVRSPRSTADAVAPPALACDLPATTCGIPSV